MSRQEHYRLAVVGAGPQSLTLLAYLATYRPDLLETTVVIDPDDWLAAWHRQFARFRIPMLRSACVHHPHPHPYGLIRHARATDRSAELHGSIGRPSTALFADYCDRIVDEHALAGRRIGSRVVDLRPGTDRTMLVTDDGGEIVAERVVLATNPVAPVLPTWLAQARSTHRGAPGLIHSREWADDRADGPVVVVGGGLTAAQIVGAHAAAGACVTWVTRADLRVRDLDVEPVWLGSDLRRFHDARDPRARVTMARKARGGGSIPAGERQEVAELVDAGAVRHVVAAVDQVRHQRGRWQVTLRHAGRTETVAGATVVCATGSRTHVRLEPLLRRCRAEQPARHVDGIPVLGADLRWPGTGVHVMGPLAMAAVGPACRTVIGARMAAERIVAGLGGEVAPQYPWPRALR